MIVFDMEQLPDVNSQLINDVINDQKTTKLPKYKRLERYYKLEHRIRERVQVDPLKPNNKLIHDYPGYIVDTARGYFIGNPVVYSTHSTEDQIATDSNDQLVNAIKEIYRLNDEAKKNSDHAKQMGIKGESFEICYIDSDPNTDAARFKFTPIPAEEMAVIYDTTLEPEIALAVRYYTIKNVSLKTTDEFAVLYWPDRIEYWSRKGTAIGTGDDRSFTISASWTLDSEEEHYFGMVPVVHFKNNEELMGDFERVLTLIDEYNKRISDMSNEFDYFGDAYLMLKNLNGTEQEDIIKAKENRAFLVEGDGDIKFLIKDIPIDAAKYHNDLLEKNIHKFAKVPNVSDEQFAGNISGVAIKYKLWELEQLAVDKEHCFRQALNRRLDLACAFLSKRSTMIGDHSLVDQSYTRNIPANITEWADIISKLKGTVSDETLIAQLPFVADPKQEIEKRNDEETTIPLDNVNFDNPTTSGNQNLDQGPSSDNKSSIGFQTGSGLNG